MAFALKTKHEPVAVCGIVDDLTKPIKVRLNADGTSNRQPVYFTSRFGYEDNEITPEPGRYTIIGAVTCGWNRRQRIVVRLLGLQDVIGVEALDERQDSLGWRLRADGAGARFGYRHLRDFYEAADPDFQGRATSPAVVDLNTGKVVTNDYHTISLDLETVWKPWHKADAPDLYPKELRTRIDLLNEQLFDDVNDNTYRILFAGNTDAASRAYEVFAARLNDYDYRLRSRRYLFGPTLTDSDIRLFQTLEAYESMYRPGIARKLGDAVLHVWDYPDLWAYARDLFQTPGFTDHEELYEFGFIPDDEGRYSPFVTDKEQDLTQFGGHTLAGTPEFHERWLEPSGRDHLTGDPGYPGPGTAGLADHWRFAR
ncbi:glutathione S-transferase [Bifidobacterium callitrichos]|nr:glutathione S-transferase [Bifidobacterium callitrichos]